MDSTIRRRLIVAFLAMLIVIAVGSTGYWILGDGRWPWFDCLYMTVITITTVGYGETLAGMDLVPYVRAFTVMQLIFGTGVLVYFASTITAFIVEGDLRSALASGRMRRRIQRMRDHVVVCGAGSTGTYIIEELIAARVPVVAIDFNEPELMELAKRHPRAAFAFIAGDATDDDVLAQANLGSAHGVAAVLAGDKDNLYIVVSARLASPKLRVIARATENTSREMLRRAGADSVVAPNHIGGLRMVSEMLRPSVVRFLDDMLRDPRVYRIESVTLGDGCELVGKTLAEADVRERFGMSVIAVHRSAWDYNPEPDVRLVAGSILIVLGTPGQVAELREAVR